MGITVRTTDDPSYLSPPEHLLTEGVWKADDVGKRSYILRTPGYGSLYAVLINFFGKRDGLIVLVILQILAWSLAVACIPFLATKLLLPRKIAFTISYLVALLPIFFGFLSYTLTEAIVPSLVIVFYVSLFRFSDKGHRGLLMTGILLALCILIRPPLLILLFALLPVLVRRSKRLFLLVTFALMPLMIWQFRVHRISGKFDLHPIYQNDSPGIYRPLHEAVWNFHKMTGQSGADFHRSIERLSNAARGESDPRPAVKSVVDALHPGVLKCFGREKLDDAYLEYVAVLKSQNPFELRKEPINSELPGELELTEKFEELRNEYVRENFLRAWIFVPLKVMGEMFFHSNLSLYMFQAPLRGNIGVEVLRYASFFVHACTFLSLFFFPFLKRARRYVYSLAIPAVLFLGYLAFVQRGIEERYTLPFLVPALLVASAMWVPILKRFRGFKARKG